MYAAAAIEKWKYIWGPVQWYTSLIILWTASIDGFMSFKKPDVDARRKWVMAEHVNDSTSRYGNVTVLRQMNYMYISQSSSM